MAQQTWENGDLYAAIRGKVNDNFTELYSIKIEASQVLTKTNTTSFTPTANYHPSTKIYVDSSKNSLIALYDPNGIGADAFDRVNMVGVQPAASITQNPVSRFVSDVQIAIWNAKEPSITPKNTAFNVNFGTTSGTVSEGNHGHTPAQVGLGNVNNTSDLSKPISTATQTALDDKVDKSTEQIVDQILFEPQVTDPVCEEGLLYYDDSAKGLTLCPDVDMHLNLGQEEVIRVLNNTGVVIQNGTPVYISGASVGLPEVTPAIADSYSKASVPGITTHEIGIGEQGFITHAGRLGLEITGYSPGDTIYLSSTVAGGFTNTPPDIITILGTVIDSTSILVRINSNASLANIVAYMNGGEVPATIDTTQTVIDNYTSSGNVVIPFNATTGYITTPTTGIYRLTATINISYDDTGNNSGLITLALFDGTSDILSLKFTVAKYSEGTDLTAVLNFAATTGEALALRISSDETLTTVTENFVSYSIESVNIR